MNFSFAKFLVASAVAFVLCSCAGSASKDDAAEARAKAEAAYADSVRMSQMDPAQVSCPADLGLRGQGVAGSYQTALMLAQRDIAAQIESEVKSKTEVSTTSETDAEGNEIVQSSYAARSQLLTKLENAQDAKVVFQREKEGKISVVACMSYANAALPFQKKFGSLQDSVKLGIAIFQKQTHPLERHEAYKKAKNQFAKMQAVEHILAGLGFADTSSAALNREFEQVKTGYAQFRAGFAMYFETMTPAAAQTAPPAAAQTASSAAVQADSAAASADAQPAADSATPVAALALSESVVRQQQLLFERVSKNYTVRSGECNGGIKLKPSISETACAEGSLGVSCSVDISLQGESCEGNAYFSLSAKVKGTGRYDEAEAKERLNKNILEGAWFEDWTKELNKWKLN